MDQIQIGGEVVYRCSWNTLSMHEPAPTEPTTTIKPADYVNAISETLEQTLGLTDVTVYILWFAVGLIMIEFLFLTGIAISWIYRLLKHRVWQAIESEFGIVDVVELKECVTALQREVEELRVELRVQQQTREPRDQQQHNGQEAQSEAI